MLPETAPPDASAKSVPLEQARTRTPPGRRWYERLRGRVLPRAMTAGLVACFGLALAWVYAARIGQGLWEDGYFVKRFAYNFWHHGSFAWNVADGPVYGMTSQTLQALGTLLYAVAPDHLVLGLKGAGCAALLGTLPLLGRLAMRIERNASATVTLARGQGTVAMLPCLVGLSSAVLIEAALTGLETTLGLLAVALSMLAIQRPVRRASTGLAIAASVWLVYLTRPDAILIPGLLLTARWLLAALGRLGWARGGDARELGPLSACGALIALGLALMLLGFERYYGTALPLPFYVKTHGLNAQDASYVAYFAVEKLKNLTQVAFLALPFTFIALHDRSRAVCCLLGTGFIFAAYHGLATIETMGYYSRFYLPGFLAVVAAAAVAYRRYLERRSLALTLALYACYVLAFIWLKHVDNLHAVAIKLRAAMYVPALVASGLLLLCPAGFVAPGAFAIGLSLCVGTALTFPVDSLRLEDDERILLRQIRPRTVFRGIEELRARVQPKVVYHTDMGAPGLMFPEAKVVDLDGLLNEDVTLRGAGFEELCERDHPEAIYLPKSGYAQLRAEMLRSRCLARYRPVTPPDGARLFIRRDQLGRYLGR